MKYERQINWANACTNNNLDDCTSRSVRNAWIVLLFIPTLHPPKWMANSKGCTSYHFQKHSSEIVPYRLLLNNALFFSVSFKPIFIEFGLVIVIDMLALSSVFIAMVKNAFFIILHTVQTLWIFSECLVWQKFPFLFFALYIIFLVKNNQLKVLVDDAVENHQKGILL